MKIKRNDSTLKAVTDMLTWREIHGSVIAPVWMAADSREHATILTKTDGTFPSSLDECLLNYGLKPGKDGRFSEEQVQSVAVNTLLHATGLQSVIESNPEVHAYIKRRFHPMDPKRFASDPYYAGIKLPEASSGKFRLTHNAYEACEYFTYDMPQEFLPYNVAMPEMGLFTERFEYPAIMEDNHTWMSVTPNEIATMRPHVDAASGDVLALGLGMGYYAYMAALKHEVRSVTVIEISPDVIELFEGCILPQFPKQARSKVRIIRDNAIGYMKRLKDGAFDTCFADIWLGDGDGISPYIQLRRIARRLEKTSMSYWIEGSILCRLTDIACSLAMREISRMLRMPMPRLPMPDQEKAAYAFMEKLLDKEHIDTEAKLKRLASKEHIDALLDRASPEFIPAGRKA